MGQYADDIALNAGADMSANQYKAVVIGGTIAANSTTAMGLQQNKPNAFGRDLTARIAGRSKYRAGAAVVTGVPLMVTTSGWIITATSGSLPCGKSLEAVSSGSIGEGYFNFAGATNALGV